MRMYRVLSLAGLTALALTGCSSDDSPESAPSSSKVQYEDGQTATVKSVESGNTVTLDIDGSSKQVRLINVVAPSENNVEPSGQCLIQESTDYLKKKLPEGTEVKLEFDDSRVGSSGYVEAAIFVGDDNINADVVRAGLAATTFTSERDELYGDISKAQQDAAAQGNGLYSADTECSIPAQIKQAKQDAESAGEESDNDKRKSTYKKSSDVYNTLNDYAQSPSDYAGSIVTLDAVKEQLEDLKKTLGDNYYDEKGVSVGEHASASATATGRPGGN